MGITVEIKRRNTMEILAVARGEQWSAVATRAYSELHGREYTSVLIDSASSETRKIVQFGFPVGDSVSLDSPVIVDIYEG